MNQQNPHFRFHNPNTAETTAHYIVKLLLEANREKLEQALRDAQSKQKSHAGGWEG